MANETNKGQTKLMALALVAILGVAAFGVTAAYAQGTLPTFDQLVSQLKAMLFGITPTGKAAAISTTGGEDLIVGSAGASTTVYNLAGSNGAQQWSNPVTSATLDTGDLTADPGIEVASSDGIAGTVHIINNSGNLINSLPTYTTTNLAVGDISADAYEEIALAGAKTVVIDAAGTQKNSFGYTTTKVAVGDLGDDALEEIAGVDGKSILHIFDPQAATPVRSIRLATTTLTAVDVGTWSAAVPSSISATGNQAIAIGYSATACLPAGGGNGGVGSIQGAAVNCVSILDSAFNVAWSYQVNNPVSSVSFGMLGTTPVLFVGTLGEDTVYAFTPAAAPLWTVAMNGKDVQSLDINGDGYDEVAATDGSNVRMFNGQTGGAIWGPVYGLGTINALAPVAAFCGDGVVGAEEECDPPGSVCTPPGSNQVQYYYTCSQNCQCIVYNPECGDGVVDDGEQCDGGACCTATCTFASSSTVCRPITDSCDAEETCTGTSDACPADAVRGTDFLCRDSTCFYDSCSADNCSRTGMREETYCDGINKRCPGPVLIPCSEPCPGATSCYGDSNGDSNGGYEPMCLGGPVIFCGYGPCRNSTSICYDGIPQTCTPKPKPAPNETNLCSDVIDNDCDNTLDCKDSDCALDTDCGAYCFDGDGDTFTVPKEAACGDGIVQTQLKEVCDPPGSLCSTGGGGIPLGASSTKCDGDGICEPEMGETQYNCVDCGICSGDCKTCSISTPAGIMMGTQATVVCSPLDCNDSDASIYPGAPERCNEIDDDCDGEVDEDVGVEETCDGIDNDCDGVIDDPPEGGWGICDTGLPGLCAVGEYACEDNELTCQQTVLPTEEVCDGFDNDCDDAIDEELGSTTCGIGACQVTVNNCVDGVPQVCVPNPPQLEICDNIDNDCDAEIDETYPEQGQACDTGVPGVCADGTYLCNDGDLACDQTIFPTDEICDDLDNNCDGPVDEDLTQQCYGYDSGCTYDEETGGYDCAGICKAGTQTCSAGQWSTCIGEVGPATETCNNIDDNCNAAIDENDAEAPVTEAAVVPENWVNHDVTLTLTATDMPETGQCGVLDIYSCIDQADTCSPNGITSLVPITRGETVTVSNEGINYVRFYAIDAKGEIICGDDVCNPAENNNNCPSDCPVVCGNSVVESGEFCDSPASTPAPQCTDPNARSCTSNCLGCSAYCGNGICESNVENANNCGADCWPMCGNNIVEPPESCDPPGYPTNGCEWLGPNYYCHGCFACHTPYCGNGKWEPLEVCDWSGTPNGCEGIPNSRCASNCKTCEPLPPSLGATAAGAAISSEISNVEVIKSVTIKIDKTAPVTTFETGCKFGQIDNFCKDRANAWTTNVTDELSGANSTYYCTDPDGPCTPSTLYEGEFVTELFGQNYVCFASKDNAGNMEEPKCTTADVDQDLDKDGFYDITRDWCDNLPGPFLGCPFGDLTKVWLHIIDHSKKHCTSACCKNPRGDEPWHDWDDSDWDSSSASTAASSEAEMGVECGGGWGWPWHWGWNWNTKYPLNNTEVKIFDRNDPAFQAAYTKNPKGSLYDDIFEANIGLISGCITDERGQCIAPETAAGDYLVIAKWIDGDNNDTKIYVGRPKSGSDFKSYKGTAAKLATKDMQIIKYIDRYGRISYQSGSKIVVVGSALEVVYPEDVTWINDREVYPFIFASDSDWSVDVCLEVPEGYVMEGVLDDTGTLTPITDCAQTFVTGETKVIVFSVAMSGSPEPNFVATLKTTHDGKTEDTRIEITGTKAETAKSDGAQTARKIGQAAAEYPESVKDPATMREAGPEGAAAGTQPIFAQTPAGAQAVNVNALMPAVLLMIVLTAIAIFALRRAARGKRKR